MFIKCCIFLCIEILDLNYFLPYFRHEILSMLAKNPPFTKAADSSLCNEALVDQLWKLMNSGKTYIFIKESLKFVCLKKKKKGLPELVCVLPQNTRTTFMCPMMYLNSVFMTIQGLLACNTEHCESNHSTIHYCLTHYTFKSASDYWMPLWNWHSF